MKCPLHAYDYGHAGCCRCGRDLALASRPPCLTFRQGNLGLYFFYCRECFDGLQAEGPEACKKAVGDALKQGAAAAPRHTGLAMTTSLALQAHGGDLVRAYEIGVEVPRVLHDAIVAGQADAVFVPDFGWEV